MDSSCQVCGISWPHNCPGPSYRSGDLHNDYKALCEALQVKVKGLEEARDVLGRAAQSIQSQLNRAIRVVWSAREVERILPAARDTEEARRYHGLSVALREYDGGGK